MSLLSNMSSRFVIAFLPRNKRLNFMQSRFSVWVCEPGISQHVLCLQGNKQGGNIQPCCTPLPIVNQSVASWKVLTATSWHACRFLRSQVMWFGIPISLRIFHSVLWSTQSKAFTQSMKQMFFWNYLDFSMIQRMLAIWSVVPLPSLNPACTSGSS